MKARVLMLMAMGFASAGMVLHRLHGRCCLVALWLTVRAGNPMPPEVTEEQAKIRDTLKQ